MEEKLYLERPSIDRKDEAIDYINEHIKYGSAINGTGSLDKCVIDENTTYEMWLDKINKQWDMEPSELLVPAETYFLVRESDNKIVGMINIRKMLNNTLIQSGGGHIGYGIRPSERRKGYNKVNLYLGLKRLQELGIKEAMLGCVTTNLGSSKTMKALGAKLSRTTIWKGNEHEVYLIDVDKSLEEYKDTYEKLIARDVLIPEKSNIKIK